MSADGAAPAPHPLVAQTFATLDEAGVDWVLRSGDIALESAEPLELALAPADAARLGPLLATIGFAPVRSDRAGRRFLRYDEGSDRWIQLVVLTGEQEAAAASGARGWAQRLGARAGAAGRIPAARGRSVALLGPDGSGKSTLAKGIAASFPLPSRLLYMGLWGRDEPATALGMVLAAAKRPPRAWLRYGVSQYHRLRGRLVIFDRYPYDAYQPAAPPLVALKRVYFAVLARCCPAPDLVLLIDTPPEVAFERKPEDPLEQLAALHDAYMALAPRVPHVQILPGDQTAQQVRADAMGRIWRMHLAHWAPGAGESSPAGVQENQHTQRALDLYHAGQDRRNQGRLAAARRLVPEILAALPPSPDLPPPQAWATHSAVWSSTGIAVFGVGPARGAPVAMVKIPSTAEGAASQRREGEAVAALRSDQRAADWADLVPVRLAEGTVDGRSYLVESAVPGVPAARLLAGGAGAAAVLQTAASCIATLHRRTATEIDVDQARLHRWVDEPLTAVRSLTGNAAAVQQAGDELHAALRDRPVAEGWVHGNYTPGNVVMNPDTRDVRGVIDWDWAAPDDLGVLDVVHLLVSAHGDASDRELGDLVAAGLRGEAWCGDLRGLLEPSLAASLPGEPPGDRVLLLLFWLRHVTANLRQRPAYYRRNWVWKRRNVEAVLRAL